MQVEAPSPELNLENHFLLFKTYYGALSGWNIPPEILAEHHIYPSAPVYEIIALDYDGLKAPNVADTLLSERT